MCASRLASHSLAIFAIIDRESPHRMQSVHLESPTIPNIQPIEPSHSNNDNNNNNENTKTKK